MIINNINLVTLHQFAQSLLIKSGCDEHQAKTVAEILVWCDMIGRGNQGVWRLPIFCKRLSLGLTKSPCQPKFTKVSECIEIMDGDNGVGHYVASLGMNRAIEIAKNIGVGIIAVKHSNFFGAGAYYINQATEKNMIGLAMSNSFPKVAAYGGIKSVLGTNPIAFGAPKIDGKHFLVDMATSASAGSTIRKYIEKNAKLPEGIVADEQGNPITNPNDVDQGALLPYGGAKGFALSLMIEILAGVITGAGVSHDVKSVYKDFKNKGNNGHFLLALDVERLIPINQYYQRMEMMISLIKSSSEGFPDKIVRYPGEVRWENYANAKKCGIELGSHTINQLSDLADQLNVNTPW